MPFSWATLCRVILGIHSGDGKGSDTRRIIGETTAGNVWYRIGPDRQRMFFKLLSESPEGSDEGDLFKELFRRLREMAHEGIDSEDREFAAGCRTALKELEQQHPIKATTDCRLFYDFGFLLVREFKSRFNSLGERFAKSYYNADLHSIKSLARDLGLVH